MTGEIPMLIRPRTTVIAGLLIIAGLLGVGYWWSVNDGAFAPRPEQSWDQENLKRHDSGCPTAIYDAPGGNLRLCGADTPPAALNDNGPELDPAVVIWHAPTPTRPDCMHDCRQAREARHGPIMRLRPEERRVGKECRSRWSP